jgi:uncharacterized phage protein gp47/JayE
MTDFGVTPDGFVLKPFDAILGESMGRARGAFGADVDLTPTSPLRKILDLTAAEDALLWQRLEELYYSAFASSAVGDELDLIGENVGLERRELQSRGEATLTVVAPPAPDRRFTLPEGAVFVTTSAPAGVVFHTTAPVTLVGTTPVERVPVQAFDAGPGGDLVVNATLQLDPVYALLVLQMQAPTTVNAAVTTAFARAPEPGASVMESDEDYRARILGLPRNIWTVDAVRAAALSVPGVVDVAISDPLGGVDVSQSYFNLFRFDERLFSGERRLGEPYFFDVVVAHEFARPWRTETVAGLVSPVTGIYEQVLAEVDRVRPVGIHPTIVEADHIEVGVRADVVVDAGFDPQALRAAFKQRLTGYIGELKLGGVVQFSQVMRAIVDQPGVVDVQNMHLRRCPPAFGRITFGAVPFQSAVIEAPTGDSLALGQTEVAIFRLDSDLTELELVPR